MILWINTGMRGKVAVSNVNGGERRSKTENTSKTENPLFTGIECKIVVL
jgi:hypothetical protein